MWHLSNGLWQDDEFPFEHFFTAKKIGDLRDLKKLKSFCSERDIDYSNIVSCEQVHSNKVVAADRSHLNKNNLGIDGFVTKENNLGLSIFTADCISIFLGDKNKNSIGLIHAGWRGLAKGIIFETIKIFNKELNLNPETLIVSIGPHIQKCCYSIGDELRKTFNLKENEQNLDLGKIAVKQLQECGIKRIVSSYNCTCHEPEFFSYRRDKTKERMMSFIINR